MGYLILSIVLFLWFIINWITFLEFEKKIKDLGILSHIFFVPTYITIVILSPFFYLFALVYNIWLYLRYKTNLIVRSKDEL